MCDLLLVSFSREYRAPRTLYEFMLKSIEKGDIDGWGIGFFLSNRRGVVVKDVDIDKNRRKAGRLFSLSARIIESEIIMAHFRLATRKHIYGAKYAHPFKAHFLGDDWIFAHNGASSEIINYETIGPKLHEHPEFDSPFVFEFIRDRMVEYVNRKPLAGLFDAVRYAVEKLYEAYEGTYNFILANSNVAFINLDGKHPHNNKMFLEFRKRRTYKDKLLMITTVENLFEGDWLTIKPENGYRGKLMVVSEGELLLARDIEG